MPVKFQVLHPVGMSAKIPQWLSDKIWKQWKKLDLMTPGTSKMWIQMSDNAKIKCITPLMSLGGTLFLGIAMSLVQCWSRNGCSKVKMCFFAHFEVLFFSTIIKNVTLPSDIEFYCVHLDGMFTVTQWEKNSLVVNDDHWNHMVNWVFFRGSCMKSGLTIEKNSSLDYNLEGVVHPLFSLRHFIAQFCCGTNTRLVIFPS